MNNYPPVDKLMSCKNILYHIMKAYNKEFVKGKQSFLQRVVQEDDSICRHFVGVVTNIETNLLKEHVIHISDGSYSICTGLIQQPDNTQTSCESRLKEYIEMGKIYVGQKLHMVNQSLKKHMKDCDFSTEHYFLQNQGKYELVLNLNGIHPAKYDHKLGA